MSSSKKPIKRNVEASEIQRLVKQKKFLHYFVYTKDNKFVLPFSRRSVDINLQQLIDSNDASLLVRCAIIDVRIDYTQTYPNKKVIRIIDETIETIDDVYAMLK